MFKFFRDIATAIKDLLDAVNEVFKNCQSVGKMSQYKEVCFLYWLPKIWKFTSVIVFSQT